MRIELLYERNAIWVRSRLLFAESGGMFRRDLDAPRDGRTNLAVFQRQQSRDRTTSRGCGEQTYASVERSRERELEK